MFSLNLTNFNKEGEIFLKIGLPILGSQLVMYGMTTTDYIMAGYASSSDLAGVGLAAAIFNPAFFLSAGVMFGITPIIAQLYGAKDYALIKVKSRKFLWTALIVGVIFFIFLRSCGFIFNFLEAERDMLEISTGYLSAISFGAIPMTIFQALRGYSEGITKTKVVFFLNLFAFLLNIPLNYLFIFYFDLGGVGCGVATALVAWIILIIFFLITKFSNTYKKISLYGKFIWPDISSNIELLKLGIPISFGIFVELSMFSGAALIISFFGANTLAAHTVAINLVGLLFMIPLSLGLCSAIRVGNLIGEKKHLQANYAANFSMRISFFLALINFLVIIFFHSFLVGLYTRDIDVAEIAVTLLMLAAIFQIPDAIGFSAIGSLRGHKDTFATMVIMIISYWLVALPLGMFLAFNSNGLFPDGAQGIWIGMIFGIIVSAVLNSMRLRYKKNRLKQLFKLRSNKV